MFCRAAREATRSFSGSNFGEDVVNYFNTSGKAHDILQFSATDFQNFADVMSHAAQVGSNVVITADAADAVTLHNVKIKS